jgi:hypothetical protein
MLSLLVIVALLLTSVALPPCRAQERASPYPQTAPEEPHTSSSQTTYGELMIADVLIMRPLGFAACIIGLTGAVVALPFAAITNSQDAVVRTLIEKPFQYTFQRPVGQVEWQ